MTEKIYFMLEQTEMEYILYLSRKIRSVSYTPLDVYKRQKLYSTKENSFWCCVGSGFENHAKYGEAIYYHNNQGIYVNPVSYTHLDVYKRQIGYFITFI